MKKVERKKKPAVKLKESPRRFSSISSLKYKKSDSKKDLQEGNTAKEKNKLQNKLDEIETEDDIDSKQSISVIKEILPPAIESFVPQLYHFRLPGGSRSSLDTSLAETPPFWLLLDHTLGVIWALFSPSQQKSKLGVSELHWALEFLKGIRPSRGEHPKDVKLCINAVEDKLIELYAKTTNTDGTYEGSSIGPSSTSMLPTNVEDKLIELYAKTTNTDGTYEGSSIGPSSTSMLPTNGLRKVSGSVVSLGRYTDNMGKRSFLSTSVGKTTQTFPPSVTYEEILNRSPRSVQQLYRAEPKKFYRSEGVIIEEDVHLEPSKSNVSVPYNKLVEFLIDWRREQVDRIQNELKRLHSIEEFMSALEKEDFQPFVDGHLPQKISEMKATIRHKLLRNLNAELRRVDEKTFTRYSTCLREEDGRYKLAADLASHTPPTSVTKRTKTPERV